LLHQPKQLLLDALGTAGYTAENKKAAIASGGFYMQLKFI
jgi:hypothetical protein